MNNTTTTTRNGTWVAFGDAGAVGSIHRMDDGYLVRLLGDEQVRRVYPSLEVAKSALVAALPAGTGRPEFREH